MLAQAFAQQSEGVLSVMELDAAARAKHHLQILSTQTSTAVEEVAQGLVGG